ncbi:SAM-dependent methyltransferase [Pseudonocardia sp. DLS-67]
MFEERQGAFRGGQGFRIAAVVEAIPVAAEQLQNLEREYGSTSNPAYLRTRTEFSDLFDGLELVEPGVVYASDWRNIEPGDPARPCIYGAVGRKP